MQHHVFDPERHRLPREHPEGVDQLHHLIELGGVAVGNHRLVDDGQRPGIGLVPNPPAVNDGVEQVVLGLGQAALNGLEVSHIVRRQASGDEGRPLAGQQVGLPTVHRLGGDVNLGQQVLAAQQPSAHVIRQPLGRDCRRVERGQQVLAPVQILRHLRLGMLPHPVAEAEDLVLHHVQRAQQVVRPARVLRVQPRREVLDVTQEAFVGVGHRPPGGPQAAAVRIARGGRKGVPGLLELLAHAGGLDGPQAGLHIRHAPIPGPGIGRRLPVEVGVTQDPQHVGVGWPLAVPDHRLGRRPPDAVGEGPVQRRVKRLALEHPVDQVSEIITNVKLTFLGEQVHGQPPADAEGAVGGMCAGQDAAPLN